MKSTRRFWVMLALSAVAIANSIIWSLGMMFNDGILDINALHSQRGWVVEEGWFEAGMFLLIGILGIKEISRSSD